MATSVASRGVGQDAHAQPLGAQLGKGLDPGGRGHKVGRYQVQRLRGRADGAAQLLADEGGARGLAQDLLGRVAHQVGHGPVHGQLRLQQVLHEGGGLQRLAVVLGCGRLHQCLAAAAQTLECPGGDRVRHLVDGVGGDMVPVAVEVLLDGEHGRADGQHVQVGKHDAIGGAKVFVADIAPAHDAGLPVR
nr:hypothetical protein [Comamonas aquatica]